MKATKIIAVLAVALVAGTMGLTSCSKGGKAKSEQKESKKDGGKSVVLAESDFDVKFTEDESGCIITGFHGDYSALKGKDVTFPSTVQGLPVKGINNALPYRAASITIPEGVEWINDNTSKAEIAFEDRKDGSCGVSYVVQEPGGHLAGPA